MPAHSPLLFVYNADSGVLNGLKDLLVKTVMPQNYDCQLCAVTYGFTGMRREWKEFVAGLGTEVRFLHRDELEREFGGAGLELPAAFQLEHGQLKPFIAASELRACRDLGELVALVRSRLQAG